MRSYYIFSILLSLALHFSVIIDFPFFKKADVSVEVDSSRTSFQVTLGRTKKKAEIKKENLQHKKEIFKAKKSMNTVEESSKAKSSIVVKDRFIPKYPYKSRIFNEQGVVLVEVTLDENEKVLGSIILKSSGHERLDLAALDASRKSRFSIKEKGRRRINTHTLEFNFKLED
ncbi:MAG: hypothetical protein CES88_09825 [Halobacteriovorax sp. JY17]|nr:MAG: hypothetical protein CES88_09825 [Halobacteriovorax sp. JY17]